MNLRFESYDLLKAKIGDDAARAVVNLVQAETLEIQKTREGMMATKEDLAKLETNLTSKIYTIGIGLGLVQLIGLVAAVFAIVKFLQN